MQRSAIDAGLVIATGRATSLQELMERLMEGEPRLRPYLGNIVYELRQMRSRFKELGSNLDAALSLDPSVALPVYELPTTVGHRYTTHRPDKLRRRDWGEW